MTQSEARSEGFELEDYTTDEVVVWPDNRRALGLFQRVGTRWVFPAMGSVPLGLRWMEIYPLMDRLRLPDDEWDDLHTALMVMERAAVKTMHKFAPRPSGS